MSPYTVSLAATGDWQHVVGRRGQLRVNAAFAHIDNRRNRLESGNAVSLGVGLDRAFSSRFGGGLQLSGNRQDAKEPGYATAGGGITGYLFREFGKTTLALNLGYSHLEADRRLFLFTRRRVDDDVTVGISSTFRQLRIGSISPLVRLKYERNASRVELYDYRRFAGEVGIVTAF
jgi:hypothetical protein